MGKYTTTCPKDNLDRCQRKHAVKCSLCAEILACSTDDTAPLLEHLHTKHPNIKVALFPPIINKVKEDGDGCSMKKIKATQEDIIHKNHHKKNQTKKTFETTVEVWKCSQSPKKCENCGVCATPIIRQQKNAKTQSSTAALFLLGCWPFCFLPYLMGRDGPEDIQEFYCSKCGHRMNKDVKID